MPESSVLYASPRPDRSEKHEKADRPKDEFPDMLGETCRELGLGFKWNKGAGTQFSNADDLFEMLDEIASGNPTRLADMLVMVDVEDLGKAFSSFDFDGNKSNCWRPGDTPRAGVAVELLLRFPQVFFVFLSYQVSGQSLPSCDQDAATSTIPDGYCTLCQDFMQTDGSNEPRKLIEVRFLSELWRKTHFFSPDDTAGLKGILLRFALGVRTWFDPTGLRTIVRDRFLGTVFENDSNRRDTSSQRDILKERLCHMAVAIDEEREFAVVNAYAAYRHGHRAWFTTRYRDFTNPLWRLNEAHESTKVTVFRDIDLKFPDIPPDEKGIRIRLRNVEDDLWREKLQTSWRVLAISGECEVLPALRDNKDSKVRTGQSGTLPDGLIYYGHQKPLASIFDLFQSLSLDQNGSNGSILSRMAPVKIQSGGHGAPYVNLSIAECMLRQSRHYQGSPIECILGALLAGEAYSLLFGMSKTTALEALLQVHASEVKAEIAFPGIADQVKVEPRERDVERTLDNLYTISNGASPIPIRIGKKIKSIFLSQFWAELRKLYREGERFGAAEYANRAGLAYSFRAWCEKLPLAAGRLIPPVGYRGALYFIWMGTRLRGWATNAVGLVMLCAFFYYGMLSPTAAGDCLSFGSILQQTILSSLGLQLTDELNRAAESSLGGGLLAIFHISGSYVLFGLLISMLYRKLTRA